jgi:hypothetical protein
MKYCVHCGNEIHDDAVICVKCGRSVESSKPAAVQAAGGDDTLTTVIKVFLIVGCVAQGWMLLPLAWCLPITISIFNRIRDRQPIGTGLKVCALLFVNLIAGICLLCMNDDK